MPIHKMVNARFFNTWSPDMAYVLGYFAADGNLTTGKRGNHYIEFTSCDLPLLEKVRRVLGSTHRISVRNGDPNWRLCHRLQIGNGRMYSNLVERGFTKRKSMTMRFPRVPEKYLPHFVRGYFDGDGGVTISTYQRAGRNGKSRTILAHFTSGSMAFLRVLHAKLKTRAGIIGGSLYYHQGNRLYFSVHDSYVLYRFMYQAKSLNLFLQCKRRVFEKYFKIA